MRHRLSAVTLLSLALVLATGGMASPSSRDALAGPLEVRNVSPAVTRTIEFETTEVTRADIALSPDGEWLVFTMLGHLFRLPVEGGTAEQMTFGPYYHSDPVFSPDGLRLAFVSDRDGSDGNVFVLDLVDGQITQVTHEPWAARPTWTPDRESIVYLAFMRELALFRGQSPPFADVRRIGVVGGGTETLSNSPGFFRSVFHLADGRLAWTVLEDPQSPQAATRIEVRGDDGTTSTLYLMEGVASRVMISAASEGMYSRRYVPPRRGPEDLLFAPLGGGDARRVARVSDPLSEEASFGVSTDGGSLYLGQGGRLWRLELPGGRTHLVPFSARVRLEVLDPVTPERADLTTTRGGQRPRSILHPRLSPDGRSLVFGAAGYLWRQPLDGGVARRMFEGGGFEWEPAWSPDGQQLAFLHRESGEQEVRVFSFDEDQTRTLASGSRYFGLNWSPDGERVVFVEAARTAESIVAVSLDDGSRVQLVEALTWLWARPHFSVDGRALFLSPGRASPPELGTLQRVVLDGNSEPQALAHITDMRDALVAPGEDWLAFRRNAEIWVAPLDTRPVTEASVRLLSPVGGQTFSFTPDGSAVIYAQGDRVWRHPLTGGDRIEIPIRLELARPVPPAVLIRDVNVLDFNSGGFRGESSVLIEDGRIRWIDSEGERSPPPGTAILDGGGRFAIPGLFDMHLHTDVTGAYQEALLAYGVTSVRDVGAPLPLVRALADRGEFTPNPVPRYFYSGDVFEGVQPDPPRHNMVKPALPEEARRHVRLWDQMGASFIKVHPPIPWPLQRVVADEARTLGLPVVGHGVTLEEMIKSAILGYWSLEHGPNAGVFEDVLQLFATVGTRMTPTLNINWGSTLRLRFDREQFTAPKLRAFIPEWWQITGGGPPWSIASPLMRGLWAERLAAVRSAYEAGVALQIGTDAQNGVPRRYPGVSLHWELQNFVEASIPPLEVLRIATQEAAVAVGAEDDLGTLEVGKLADIVLLDANPLENIKNTQTIWRVIKGGWVFDPEELQRKAVTSSGR